MSAKYLAELKDTLGKVHRQPLMSYINMGIIDNVTHAIDKRLFRTAAHCLDGAFEWHETVQGVDYWQRAYDELQALHRKEQNMTTRRLLTSMTQSTTYTIELTSEEIESICQFDQKMIPAYSLKTQLVKHTPAHTIHYERQVPQIKFKLSKDEDNDDTHIKIHEYINNRLDSIASFV